jgi:hypothetical protein
MIAQQRRPAAARKFQTKHSNYVSSNVNKSLPDAKLGRDDSSLSQSKEVPAADIANYNTKPQDSSFQDQLRRNGSNSQMQLTPLLSNDVFNVAVSSREAAQSLPKMSQSPRPEGALGDDS